MSRFGRAAPALAVALLLCAPGVASAASVSVTSVPGNPSNSIFGFRAAPGERNRLAVQASFGEAPTWTVRDRGAPLGAGPGCQKVAAHEVRCASERFRTQTRIDIALGDRGDTAALRGTVSGIGSSVRLGDGDDSIQTDWTLLVAGGAGDDALTVGGDAAPSLLGGDGNDTLRAGIEGIWMDGGLGDDLIDGRRNRLGRSTVTYASRRAPIRVDLAAGIGGQRDERDTLRGLRSVVGGRGNDVLLGTRLSDSLDGRAGADVVRARGGRDGIGVDNHDRVWAGDGDDGMAVGDHSSAQVRCGRGSDSVDLSEGLQREGPLLSRCEFVNGPDGGPKDDLDRPSYNYEANPSPIRRTRGGRLTFRIGCTVRCSGRLRVTGVRAPFREVASAGFGNGGEPRGSRVSVQLPARVAALARRRTLVLRISIRGDLGPTNWRLPMRLPAT